MICHIRFTSFSFAAIAITFWYAGTGPGLIAIVLSCFNSVHCPGRTQRNNERHRNQLAEDMAGKLEVFVKWFYPGRTTGNDSYIHSSKKRNRSGQKRNVRRQRAHFQPNWDWRVRSCAGVGRVGASNINSGRRQFFSEIKTQSVISPIALSLTTGVVVTSLSVLPAFLTRSFSFIAAF
jgi:hypothetical protein